MVAPLDIPTSAQMPALWRRRRRLAILLCLTLQAFRPDGFAQPTDATADPNGGLGVEQADSRRKGGGAGNKPEPEQWFMNVGFCMYITWGLDSQLGLVASHSLAGASDDYINRFFAELPKTFSPSSSTRDTSCGWRSCAAPGT